MPSPPSRSNYHLPRREVEDTKLILHLLLLHLQLRQLNKITSCRKSPFLICCMLDSGCLNLGWSSWIAHGDKMVASIPIEVSFINLKFANFFKSNQQIDYNFPCVCTVIYHRWRHSVWRTKSTTRDVKVAWMLFFTHCDVFCDILQYTHTQKCYLFVSYNKNSNGLLKDFAGMKKEKQVRWRGFDVICVCVL